MEIFNVKNDNNNLQNINETELLNNGLKIVNNLNNNKEGVNSFSTSNISNEFNDILLKNGFKNFFIKINKNFDLQKYIQNKEVIIIF